MTKGKLYLGAPGVGKTTTLKAECEALDKPGKNFITARYVSSKAQEQGLIAVENLGRNSLHLFIDDIGHEATPVNHFGTVIHPLADLIQARYDSYFNSIPRYEITTHFTTNLTQEQLRERYGDFIFDRLVEMCEWIEIKGVSYRK